jgi:hypothetical protein
MAIGRVNCARIALFATVATALVCAAFGGLASSALAWGDRDRDSYTANITPTSAPAGESTMFDVALANTSSPGSGLGSALITPPLGFKVTGASLPPGTRGRVYVILNVVVLDHLNVPPGSSLHVAVTARAPARCGSPFDRWLTFANEGGVFGEDLRLDSAHSSLTTTVTCATATAVQFGTQPSDALVGEVITGSPNDPTGPPVTVELVDASGNVVDSSAPVTVALGENPGGATLGGTTTQNAVHGVATFDDLTLDRPDNGYTLVASSGELTSSTSSPFNENNSATSCPAGQTCSATLSTANSSLTVDVGSGPEDATLTESVDVGTPQTCAGYTPPETSVDWYEFVVSQSDRTKTVTWTVKNTSSRGFKVCFGAPYPFQSVNQYTGALEGAPEGTLPDGSSGFVGILPTCRQIESSGPCVASLRSSGDDDDDSYTSNWKSGDGGHTGKSSKVVAVISIPTGLSGDPFLGR